jgi:nucleoside-diphosphate-sugar epimerase
MGIPVVVNRRRLLITGCNGFIGRALSRRCLAEGMTVKGTVRSASKSSRLPDGVEPVIVSDIGPDTDWSVALGGVDEVVHLAARVHVRQRPASNGPDDYFRINTAGTACLARDAATAGVRRMVFLSTVKVHGEGREKPYSETDREAPQGSYAVSKHSAENALKEVSKRTPLETVVLRPPLVYGPGVGANFFRLIRLLDRRLPLPLASVSNRRSMIFVDNLVDAILACLGEPKAAGRTYLAADEESLSTPELIVRLAGLLGVPARLFAAPPALLRLAGILAGKREETDRLLGTLVADTSRIQQELAWRPRYSISEGLKTTIAWYRETVA